MLFLRALRLSGLVLQHLGGQEKQRNNIQQMKLYRFFISLCYYGRMVLKESWWVPHGWGPEIE